MQTIKDLFNKKWLRIICKLLITAAALMPELYLLLMALFSPDELRMFFISLSGTVFLFILFVWLPKRKRTFAVLLILGALFWAATLGDYVHRKDVERKTVRTDVNIDLDAYLPFDSQSKIAVLDEPATLTLTSDLPRLDGAAAVFPLYSAFVNAVYPETKLNTYFGSVGPFNYFNTPGGYRALAERQTDIFFGAYPSEDQIAYAKEQGTEFIYTPIGKEAFVFFVNAKSDVDDLSAEDIRRIYAGEVKDWSELGFAKGEIKAFQRNEGSGSQSMFLRFMGDTVPEKPPVERRQDLMIGAYEVVSDYVNNSGAIGFSFRYYLESVIGRDDIKMISVDGVAPTIENIESGAYPITGYLYAVTWEGNPNENVERLLAWICGEQGQELVEKTGYAPVKEKWE